MKLLLKAAQKQLMLREQAEKLIENIPELFSRTPNPTLNAMKGIHGLRRTGSGEEFWQFREYNIHNTLQDIDWRQSGKTDDVYIRQKERQSRQITLFWCASGPNMDFRSQKNLLTKAQAAKIILLALSLLTERSGEKAGWLGEKGYNSANALEQRLLNGNLEASALPNSIDKISRNSKAVLAGDFLEPIEEIRKSFEEIAAYCKDVYVIQILDPLEIDLPCEGRIIFQDPGGNSRETINHVGSIRDPYKKSLENHLRDVELLCRNYGWTYMFYRTDEDSLTILLQLWQQMNSGKNI